MRKRAEKSKTLWLGSLMCLISILSFLQGHDFIISNPTLVSSIGLVSGILVIILRFLTDQPLAKPKRKHTHPSVKDKPESGK